MRLYVLLQMLGELILQPVEVHAFRRQHQHAIDVAQVVKRSGFRDEHPSLAGAHVAELGECMLAPRLEQPLRLMTQRWVRRMNPAGLKCGFNRVFLNVCHVSNPVGLIACHAAASHNSSSVILLIDSNSPEAQLNNMRCLSASM